MIKIYKLQNQIKHYEWGSPVLIPQFLGVKNSNGEPYAEMWMGTHKSAPSKVYGAAGGSEMQDLEEISGEIPFLFKILGVEKPLSIQVHPNQAQAAEGFRREEELGIPLDSPSRNYKDPNHKPEVLCAVSPFSMMAGFRKPEEINRALEDFILMIPQSKDIITPLLSAIKTGLLQVFFRILFDLTKPELEHITKLITEVELNKTGKEISMQQWKLMKNLAAQYPTEAAILSPVYLNFITLQPGQSIFIPAGILHSYISGFGVELMANSDNVLRCGLTPKFVDIPELTSILDFNPNMPKIVSHDSSPCFRYQHPCSEFFLLFMQSDGSERLFPEKGPAICIVTEGELHTGQEKFKKGESFFIPRGVELLSFSGNYSLFAAIALKE